MMIMWFRQLDVEHISDAIPPFHMPDDTNACRTARVIETRKVIV
jgi:hypothetical protein